jgi:hypothetical protein
MTSLSGTRVLIAGKDRLFEPLSALLLITDGLGIAIRVVATGGSTHLHGQEDGASATCVLFPTTVYFPSLLPTAAVALNSPLSKITFRFEAATPDPIPPGMVRTTVKGYGHAVLGAITPVYVNFCEQHRKWLRTKYPGGHRTFPPFYQFARAVRNFISHGAGHVIFDNKNDPAVSWHHLRYSAKDEGKRVIGGDIHLAEMIILLFEFADALDQDGCPLSPP